MTPVYAGPTVIIGEVAFPVEVAVTPEQRRQGLSGRESLEAQAGMLFVYDSPRPMRFWMVRMQFPLDFVWIGSDCIVGEITHDVPFPPPDAEDAEIARVGPSAEMQFVVEINGGEAEELGLGIGQTAEFAGSIEGRFGC